MCLNMPNGMFSNFRVFDIQLWQNRNYNAESCFDDHLAKIRLSLDRG